MLFITVLVLSDQCGTYVKICNPCGYCVSCFFIICAEIATVSLLRPEIDAKHHAKRWENGEKLGVLMLRTPRFNWMIHHAWHERLVSSLLEIPCIFMPR